MIKKLFLVLCIIIGIQNTYSQTTVPGGSVYGTWTLAGSPYNVTGSVQIPNDSTLTIQPGVTVNFQGHYKMLVAGRLLAIGTIADTITFTAANTTTGWFGIRFSSVAVTNDTSKIYYCKLQYGKATGAYPDNNGGAIYLDNSSMVSISNNRITNNSANLYGGGIYAYNSSPDILKNTISNNTTAQYGGGMYIQGSHSTISNNHIIYNSATLGGGISLNNAPSYPVLSYNIISNNTASTSGGALYIYGPTPMLTNELYANNSAPSGGAIWCYLVAAPFGGTPLITNCTFVNNAATNGGAFYGDALASPVFKNCILWGNTASNLGPQVYLVDEPSDPGFNYCNVEGGSAAFELNGNFYSGTYTNNLNSNPNFVAPSGGSGTGFNGVSANWSLQNTSPCIDKGDPAMITQSTDLTGNPRITVCRIDQGAYEYQGGIPFAASITQIMPVTCNGYVNAALFANVTGSGSPYTYSWNPGGSTNDTLANVGAGTYTLTALNASGCSRTATYTITEPGGMILNSSQTDIACNGNCTGSATATVSGGTTPYHYSWTSAVNDTLASTPSTLCSGPYTVTVTDNQGCIKTKTVTITTPSALSFTTVLQQVSCFGGNNGKITVNATGGSSPLQYSNDGGTNYQLSNVFTGLTAGTYSVVTKDVNGCQTSITTVTITEPALLTTSTTQIDVVCYGATTGSATAVPNGGTPGYTYSWNTSSVQTTTTAINLGIGNYTVTVTDQNGCISSAAVSITSTLPLPTICMATVDTLSQNNLIYWDKTGFSSTDSFFVYRDTANNNYALIGKVPYDSLSEFIDTVRTLYHANGDPNATSWRYKIAVKDVCGSMSPMSPFHQTMFVQNSSGNFSWNHYQIEGQIMPVPALSNYRFERDDFSLWAWNTIQLISASSTAYTDLNYATYQATANWRIETQWATVCTPTYKIIGGNNTMAAINTSRSNIKTMRFSGIDKANTNSLNVIVYPNPARDQITVELPSVTTVSVYELVNSIGVKVLTGQFPANQLTHKIGTTGIAEGVYLLRIVNTNGQSIKKIIIQN